jgi:hypothetical protein
MPVRPARSSLVVRRFAALIGCWALSALAPLQVARVEAQSDRFRLAFDAQPVGSVLAAGSTVIDTSGRGNHGSVVTAYGGSVGVVAGQSGGAADFPGKCAADPCPNALVQIADGQSLDPRTADFEWGARILLMPNETDDGGNVVQKGEWGEAGGQWKLQVDKAGGMPSCVVSGSEPGQSTERRVVLEASVSVADGVWHQVSCRRSAAAGVQIVVDGVLRGSAAMPLVDLNSGADVTIGAKWAVPSANDQFHGVLDDVFMTVLDGSGPIVEQFPTQTVAAVPAAASATQTAVRLSVAQP